MADLQNSVESFIKKKQDNKDEALQLFYQVKAGLEKGTIRVAEKIDSGWKVNSWVRTAILLGVKYGQLQIIAHEGWNYLDKDTMSVRSFTPIDQVRLVPGGSSVRGGSYLAPQTFIMPPSYVNIGAYVDCHCTIDSHVLIGSCAQIGKYVHISAGSQIGGVLEPTGSMPVIIEDRVFVGGNCGIYEGVRIKEGAVLGTGVILNSSIPIFDATCGKFITKTNDEPLTVPPNAVIVAGSRPLKQDLAREHNIHIYCPVLIKYRDAKTEQSIELETLLHQ